MEEYVEREFIGQIIDIFEDFMDAYTGDRERIHIRGGAYMELAARLQSLLYHWKRRQGDGVLYCEGYKMYRGYARVDQPNGLVEVLQGTWLYRPDLRYWFVNDCEEYPLGTSFSEQTVTIPLY